MTAARRSRPLILSLVAAVLTVLGLLPATPAAADEPPPGPVTGTLTPGTARTLRLGTPTQHVILRLHGVAGRDLRFSSDDASSTSFRENLRYDLYGPVHGGTAALLGSFPISSLPATLQDTGWYTLDFYSDRGITGSIDITAELASSTRTDGGSVEPGQSIAVPFPTTNMVAVHFFGRVGERPTVFCSQLTLGDDSQGDPGVVNAYFEGPDGTAQPVAPDNLGCGSFFEEGTFYYQEGRVLDQTGRWTMLLVPSATGSGTFRFGLVRDPATTALTRGTATHITVTQPGVNVFRTVHLNKDDKLTLPLSNVSTSQQVSPSEQGPGTVFVRLYVPGQTRDAPPPDYTLSASGSVLAFGAAAVTGTYVLEVDGYGTSVFSFNTTPTIVRDVNLTPTLGAPTKVTIAKPGQFAKLHLHISAGQTLTLTASGSTFPTSCAASSCEVPAFFDCDACEVPGALIARDVRQSGTYTSGSAGTIDAYVGIEPIGNTTGSITLTITLAG